MITVMLYFDLFYVDCVLQNNNNTFYARKKCSKNWQINIGRISGS